MSTTKTKIEWTHRTWNPVKGCSRVSPGCLNCYAEGIASRFSGEGQPFHLFAERKPSPHWTGRVEVNETSFIEPLRWKKPALVFVNSMSDLFHEGLSFDSLIRIFRVMQRCPHLTFQVLTKRAERMADVVPAIVDHLGRLGNVWLGVSVENQEWANKRLPQLYRMVRWAPVLFASYEPALGPVDWKECGAVEAAGRGGLGWVIIGGESGHHARPFCLDWARDTISAFRGTNCAMFVKQLGPLPYVPHGTEDALCLKLKDRKGGDMEEWPPELEALKVRQYPKAWNPGGAA